MRSTTQLPSTQPTETLDWSWTRSRGGTCPACLTSWSPGWALTPEEIEATRGTVLPLSCPVCGDGWDVDDPAINSARRDRILRVCAAAQPLGAALAHLARRRLSYAYVVLVRAVVRDALGERGRSAR